MPSPAWLLLIAVAQAAGPSRRPPQKRAPPTWQAGRQPDRLVVKLVEDEGLAFVDGQVTGPGDLSILQELLAGSAPLFSRSPDALAARQAKADPAGDLADLRLYRRLDLPHRAAAEARAARLFADPRVEQVYFAFAPVQPPVDLDPATPDLRAEQGYVAPAPDGLDLIEARRWPGGTGLGVTIADIEYDWNPDHEDLDAVPGPVAWGWDPNRYPCHGTMVAGTLVAGDNGYGMTGLVPDARLLMVSPYSAPSVYSIADAVDGAAALLQPGDVILIEQQVLANDDYAPAEAEPATFDAISLAVAEGIVVVEPSANGGQDLDDPAWGGWFDRSLQDSGAILVGGGAPPGSPGLARSWTGGSSHGSRLDLQAWYSGIATLGHSTAVDSYCPSPDLFFPGNDPDQAYTSGFNGTSGASPLVVAAVVVAQAAALELRGQPFAPMDLRAALVSTGTPQQGEEIIGPQPDLRAFLRSWGVR